MNDENRKDDFEIEESNALKVIKGTGQTVDAPAPDTGIKKAGRLENFWYHHKWHAGIICGAVIIGAVLLIQLIFNKTPDVYIMYAGPGAMVGAQYERFEAAVEEAMSDYDGNGYKKISFSDSTYLTQEQAAQRREMGLSVDDVANSAAYKRYQMELSAGEHMVCMLDPDIYESAKAVGAFVPLSELFDEIPASAVDEYGIRLGETEFYKSNPDIAFIPADTVIALRVPQVLSFRSEEKNEEYFERHKQMFCDMVLFAEK